MPQKSSNLALAVQLANVNVQLKNWKKESNEDKFDLFDQMTEKSNDHMGAILSNIALRDDHGVQTLAKEHQFSNYGLNRQTSFVDGHFTPLEVSL